MRPTPSDPGLSPWLELARQQSRALAERRSARPPSWRWPSTRSDQRLRRPQRAIPAWSLALGVLVVLLLASGTWAFVRKLRQVAAPPVAPAAKQLTKPAAAAAAALRKAGERRSRPNQAPGVKLPGGPESAAAAQQPRTLPAAARPRPAAASPQQGETPAAKAEGAGGEIIFSGEEMPGGGELILVTPPSRLGPLWTVEEYKRQR